MENETQKPNAENDLETAVTEMLLRLGIPAHINGYRYLRTAVIDTVNDERLLDSMTKRLYPDVAKKYGTTSSRVERGIRHAIESAWIRAEIDEVTKFFNCNYYNRELHPTNSEFIALAADRMRLRIKHGQITM